jgi:hypothetical protein
VPLIAPFCDCAATVSAITETQRAAIVRDRVVLRVFEIFIKLLYEFAGNRVYGTILIEATLEMWLEFTVRQ